MFKRLMAALRRDRTKSSDAPSRIVALQDDIVHNVVADRTDLQDFEWEDREWVYIAVNTELLVDDGRRSSTQTAVLAFRPGGELEDLDFRLSMATKAKILALRDAMRASGNAVWTIVDITIERDGVYKFSFGYGPPPRLNGDLLHAPLKGTLERYKTLRGLQ